MGRPHGESSSTGGRWYDNGALKIQPAYSPQNLIGNCTEFIQPMRAEVAATCENLG
jgi:hypothetical protein